MSEQSAVKVPVWFWILVVVCLIWNALGVMAYFAQVSTTPEMLAAMPAAERQLFESNPAWATAAFALAVFGGALGCLALLFRQGWALWLLVLSLLGVLVQMAHAFFISKSYEVYGPGAVVMPVMVIVVAVVLVWLARMARCRHWIS